YGQHLRRISGRAPARHRREPQHAVGRRRVSAGCRPAAVPGGAAPPPARIVHAANMTRVLALAIVLVALAVLPPLTDNRADILNLFFLILLYITLGQSWNVLGGFTGQVNLGHAAFFGSGVLVARQLWLAGHWLYPLAFVVGG